MVSAATQLSLLRRNESHSLGELFSLSLVNYVVTEVDTRKSSKRRTTNIGVTKKIMLIALSVTNAPFAVVIAVTPKTSHIFLVIPFGLGAHKIFGEI